MKSLTALIKREYLEHRGAFLYAPAVILLILTIVMLSGIGIGRFHANGFDTAAKIGVVSGAKGFEFGFLALSALWMGYLLIALFFYFADAFSADIRNNAMLFWKSMPQTDFKILASKMLAGLTIFPALIVGALILSGVVVFIGVVIMLLTVPGITTSSPAAFLASALNILSFDLGYLVLALLWYAPFFAWVGLLSTLFRRWSIPLAFLIPGLVGLAENLMFRNVFAAPDAGFVLDYLRHRMNFAVGRDDIWATIVQDGTFNAGTLYARFLSQVDWGQLVGGVGVAFVLVYLASEYRRRFVAT
jgi:ABC-2 type transport system permease protein